MIWRGAVSRSLNQRWLRVRRRAAFFAALAGGAVCGGIAATSPPTGALRGQWFAAVLPFLVAALGGPVWFAVEKGLPDALRLRRRSRAFALRAGWLSAFGASVAVLLHFGAFGVQGAAAHDAAVAAGWAALLTPVPLLLDQALWTFAPRGLRLDVRRGRVAEETQSLSGRIRQPRPLVFDPELGWSGRIVPRRSVAAPDTFGPPRDAGTPPAGNDVPAWWWRATPEYRLLRRVSLHWTGQDLVFVYGPTSRTAIRLGPDTPPSELGSPLAARPTELVLLREQRVLEGRWETRILLLAADGRRLLTVPGPGLLHGEVAQVARAAGLAYSRYELCVPDREAPWRNLPNLMFPRHPGHVRIRLTVWD